VRALEILHEELRQRTGFLPQRLWGALWRAVQALLIGQRLWLTALGRSLPTAAQRKHAIKAVDRLLGNERLQAERFAVSAALVSFCAAKVEHPVVLVDTMEIRYRVVAFTASLAHQGRALPFWSTTVKAPRVNARQCRRFLRELRCILPRHCRPIVITDAGFEGLWLREVEACGWDYIGRVRGQTKIFLRGAWQGCHDLHRLATKRPKNLGLGVFPKEACPQARRLVLSKRPTSAHRRIKTRGGRPEWDTNYYIYRQNAHEPLLLTTSLRCHAGQVVALYERRMGIEQSFRDLKCHRWGWGLRHCLTRSRARLEILLLVGNIALVVQQLVGMWGEAQNLQRHYQANTVRSRRVLSVFLLGALLLANDGDTPMTGRTLRRSLTRLRQEIADLAPLGT